VIGIDDPLCMIGMSLNYQDSRILTLSVIEFLFNDLACHVTIRFSSS